jgi:hypothetical protein
MSKKCYFDFFFDFYLIITKNIFSFVKNLLITLIRTIYL